MWLYDGSDDDNKIVFFNQNTCAWRWIYLYHSCLSILQEQQDNPKIQVQGLIKYVHLFLILANSSIIFFISQIFLQITKMTQRGLPQMQESHHLSPRAFGDNPTLRHKEADSMLLLKIFPDFLALVVTSYWQRSLIPGEVGHLHQPVAGSKTREGGLQDWGASQFHCWIIFDSLIWFYRVSCSTRIQWRMFNRAIELCPWRKAWPSQQLTYLWQSAS